MKIGEQCWSEQFLLPPNLNCSIYKAECKLEVLEEMRYGNARNTNKRIVQILECHAVRCIFLSQVASNRKRLETVTLSEAVILKLHSTQQKKNCFFHRTLVAGVMTYLHDQSAITATETGCPSPMTVVSQLFTLTFFSSSLCWPRCSCALVVWGLTQLQHPPI